LHFITRRRAWTLAGFHEKVIRSKQDLEETKMKSWKKPVMTTVQAGFEISRYLPAEIGACKR